MTPLEQAQKALNDYLEEHPEATQLQRKIESLLDASGTIDNRLETLRFLIQKESSKLANTIKSIQDIAEKVDK